jgi:hemoglobin
MTKPRENDDDRSWSLTEEVGGAGRLRALVTRLYDRFFDDMLIGFFFEGHDKERLIDSQIEYVRARLGDEDVRYTGPSIRRAHLELPILSGHFDRRHQILTEVLEEFEVPARVRDAWLELDRSLRPLVLRTGSEAVDEILGGGQKREESGE